MQDKARIAHVGFASSSPSRTRAFGVLLGQMVSAGDLILLNGVFGAGKTTLVQGIAAGMGIEDQITSPSFTLINQYSGRLALFHVDLFRLESLDSEVEQAIQDCAESGGVTIIEWPQMVPMDLRDGALRVDMELLGESDRSLLIHTEGTRWDPELLSEAMQQAASAAIEEASER